MKSDLPDQPDAGSRQAIMDPTNRMYRVGHKLSRQVGIPGITPGIDDATGVHFEYGNEQADRQERYKPISPVYFHGIKVSKSGMYRD
ncbi:hypothetical protein GCM10023187_36620 [Nibrella viscosa]|uniref:Uncharacterized protein n=1 Tax=Nibrella viscosa TaxID=1084524 RepID=A0ABP8KP96_9BACT